MQQNDNKAATRSQTKTNWQEDPVNFWNKHKISNTNLQKGFLVLQKVYNFSEF